MADIFAKNILRVPKLGRLFALVAQWIMLGFIRTKFGKKVSEATSSSFPFGYCLIAEKPIDTKLTPLKPPESSEQIDALRGGGVSLSETSSDFVSPNDYG